MSVQYTLNSSASNSSLNELIQTAEKLQASGRVQEAIDMYRQWLTQGRDEKKHLAWFNYGWLLQKENQVNEAFSAYEQLTNNYASYLSGNASSN